MAVETFSSFYKQYYRLILTVAQQRLPSFSDAEDLTAEVFRIAWKYHSDGNELNLPWLYQVLRNVVGNEYRRTTRADQFSQRFGDQMLNSFAESPDSALEMRRLLQLLPLQERELIYMAYWEDLTGQEIAAILGCSPVTVRVRLMRARKKAQVADRAG
ncbi:RNA polymerase sigma factor [Microterricola gilva]|uniref:RNA polymerase sigma factor n=1 Tax=Microterricola gilva TaxID=393267 RepID=UPI0013EEE8CD|nr:sigma-70 family RNA polymerase sigma factor [Microterricola gilva]